MDYGNYDGCGDFYYTIYYGSVVLIARHLEKSSLRRNRSMYSLWALSGVAAFVSGIYLFARGLDMVGIVSAVPLASRTFPQQPEYKKGTLLFILGVALLIYGVCILRSAIPAP